MKHDISPYTCVIENCPTPYHFYTTRKDWREHFLRDHPPRWRCSSCTGKRPIFQTLPAFMTHLDDNHQSQISAGSLERIMIRSTFRAFGISHCPLCNDHGFSDSPEIIEHVLGHVYDFSMYSLPWRTKTKPNLDGEILTFNPTPGPHVDDEGAYGHMRMLQWIEQSDPQEENLSAEIKANLRELAWGKEYRATDSGDQPIPNEQDYFDKDGVDYFEDDLSDYAASHSALILPVLPLWSTEFHAVNSLSTLHLLRSFSSTVHRDQLPAMANDKAAPTFMNLPLEVRHSIFEHVAVRDIKPKKLLRYWFENKEVKELIAQEAIDNPNCPTPRVVYGNDDYDAHDDESAASENDGEDDDQEDDENAEEDSDNESEDDNGGADQEDESGEDEDEPENDSEDEDEELEEAFDGAQNTQSATAGVHVPTPAPAPVQVDPNLQPADEMEEDFGEVHADEGESEGESDDDDEVEGAQPNMEEEVNDDSEGDKDLSDGDGNTAAATVVATLPHPPPPPPPPAPVFRPHHKWRHIPKFMRLTHYPPPVQLLLVSPQLNNEANNWFYNVATLRIDATGSFAHTSFFEEAFSQITSAAFSPMKNIRKVDITFVWDSAWIRADTTDSIEAIFPALLRQRSHFVYEILLQVPNLREVVIHW